MFVGVAAIGVFIPHSGSLKAKRSVVNSIKARIQSRFKASVADLSRGDVWQRATLGVAVVGNDPVKLEEMLRAIRRLAETNSAAHVVAFRMDVVPWSLEDGAEWPIPIESE
jgi:uncharacterized protein YlxP (DUF503 family)